MQRLPLLAQPSQFPPKAEARAGVLAGLPGRELAHYGSASTAMAGAALMSMSPLHAAVEFSGSLHTFSWHSLLVRAHGSFFQPWLLSPHILRKDVAITTNIV